MGYESPDVLQLKEVEIPAPKDGEVLVKVHAASVNALDWHLMHGKPFLVRVGGGLRKPKDPRLGADLAGRVEAVGSQVTQFQPGDDVFGIYTGGFAEYVAVPETKLELKPVQSSFEEAAAAGVAAITALQGLRDAGHIHAGQRVLVNGASGGVGTFAVQIAKAFGAEVTAVCSTGNVDTARSIGADHVIDYTRADFTRSGQQYDLILDVAGNRSVSDYKRALGPHGTCVIVGFSSLTRLLGHMVLGPVMSKLGNRRIGLMGVAKPNRQDLARIRELLESGKVVPVIERRYPLRETAEAIRYVEAGHARGKVVITV
jgi:NADPH:quinone reductase-like Zn-dependent oxidoreductase